MRKPLLLLILAFALSTSSFHAQAQGYFNRPEEGQIKFGVRAGATYFNMGSLNLFETLFGEEELEGVEFFEFSKNLRTKHKFGFQIGAYADIWMSPIFSFMPEINLIRKGAQFDEKIDFKVKNPMDPSEILFDGSVPFKLNTDLYYVEAPLLLGVKPVPSLTLFAGPHLSYLIFQKSNLAGEEATDDEEYIGTEGLEKLLIGGAAGAQFDITPKININARYATDFQSAFKKEENAPKMRNSGFSLSIGYSF